MDPEQVRAKMKAARERIDAKLDRLEARATKSRKPVKLAAIAAGVLIPAAYVLARRRKARRQRARARQA